MGKDAYQKHYRSNVYVLVCANTHTMFLCIIIYTSSRLTTKSVGVIYFHVIL